MDCVLVLLPIWNSFTPPLSLAYLRAALKKGGVSSRALDFTTHFREFLLSARMGIENQEELLKTTGLMSSWVETILAHKPKVVGFSVLNSNLHVTIAVAKMIKKIDPTIKIVCGGPSFTKEDEWNIRLVLAAADIVVEGEAENLIAPLVRRLAADQNIDDLPQIWKYDEKEELVFSGRTDLPDVSLIEFPEYEDFDLADYGEKNLALYFSRGCVANCTFCSNKWLLKTQRTRTAESVFSELVRNVKAYGIKKYIFNDDSLISKVTMKEIEKYCDMTVAEGLVFPWSIYGTRVERLLTGNLVTKLKNSGLTDVALGVESFSTNVQIAMGKGSSYEEADRCIKLFSDAGVGTRTWLIYGYPTETDEDFRWTTHWIANYGHLLKSATVNVFQPHGAYIRRKPGSVDFYGEKSWQWGTPASNLESRKRRFLELYAALETAKSKGTGFSYIISDPFQLRYFKSSEENKTTDIQRAWRELEVSGPASAATL